MEINKSLMRGVAAEYTRSLNTAFRIATASHHNLGAFNLPLAKMNACAFVQEQVNAVLKSLDTGNDAK